MFGLIDAARTCEDRSDRNRVFPKAGENVPYQRCTVCGLVFTTYFDALTPAEMAEHIYNDQYILADPEFADKRPRYFAGLIDEMLAPRKARTRILDYGGGEGLFARLLAQKGFEAVSVFDPYFGKHTKPDGKFDLVTAFEVAEHSCDPIETFRDALSYVSDKGVMLFSTLLLSPDSDIHWWYIAPRNGHVTIFTPSSLARVAERCGVQFLSLSNLHAFYRTADSAILQSLVRHDALALLYFSSLKGLRAYLATVRQLIRFNLAHFALNPRHWVRALLHTRRKSIIAS